MSWCHTCLLVMTTVNLPDIKLPAIRSPEILEDWFLRGILKYDLPNSGGSEAVEFYPQIKIECTLEQAAHLESVSLNMQSIQYKNCLLHEEPLIQGQCIPSFW